MTEIIATVGMVIYMVSEYVPAQIINERYR